MAKTQGELPAQTRDGEHCNGCGGNVRYNGEIAVWEHTDSMANCPGAEERARYLAAEGVEGYVGVWEPLQRPRPRRSRRGARP